MNEKDFQTQVITMLGDVLNKLNEHDNKLKTIMEQTAKNSELEFTVNDTKEKTEKLEFEVELIKKYIRK